ncbi:uncharacterized protein TRIVIDRAFT_217543 [Trichoderma virens Gv29-8]|uniref:Prion-inhibition and propagation HeLo domain-containing protein n=1 Tax=Hypocrea virens (strain Gv29-8 / FGSC 10586) TaxID=413071 RepID=G9MEW8_HYPVG|nr:uncharacterized protein TRIVIDRAFT_217543 [Trichoderma virens Gv29-8]EHK26936.1 hypothetical protein TRIVIDRAFT_217543 [Trichoderma virens Gv29-8]
MDNSVGAAFGAVSLTTSLPITLVSIVECFEYVELGRRFGKDFNKSQARLEALKLQITRWGISSGTFPDPQTGKCRRVSIDAHAAETAERLLNSILEDTQELERKSRRYGDPSGNTSAMESMLNEMDTPTQALKSKTSKIFAKRIQGVSLKKRAKWALFEKKHFDRLLEDITENLNLLVVTLPQLNEPQRELCRMEVEEIQNGQPPVVLELLHDASMANSDAVLEQAVKEAIENREPGHRWERTEVDDSVKLEQGDRIGNGFTGQVPMNRGNHKFGITIGKGNAEIHQGDKYGNM